MIGSWLKKAMRAGWLGAAVLVLAGQSPADAQPPGAYPPGMPYDPYGGYPMGAPYYPVAGPAQAPQADAPAPGTPAPGTPAPNTPAAPGHATPHAPFVPHNGHGHPGWGYCPPPPPPPAPSEPPPPRCCDERPLCVFSADYLLWGFRSRTLPPLVTSGDLGDVLPGALGQPSTRVLIGGTSVDEDLRSGVRLGASVALDCCASWVVEGSFFIVDQEGAREEVVGNGAPGEPVIARPFFNAFTNQEDADPVIVPGVLSGTVVVETPRQFFGGDLNLIKYFWDDPVSQSRVGLIFGGRYAALNQKLEISEYLQDVGGLGAPPQTYFLTEDFTTFNRFYGGQLGLVGDTRFGNITLQLLAKVAFGVNNQTLVTRASTQIASADGTLVSSTNRALLVQPSNAGRFTQERFSVLPEFGGQVFYAFNESIRIGAGYTVIYWTEVLNPEDTVDRVVALQALQPAGQVGPNRPRVDLGQPKDFWAQGLTASLQITY